MLRGLWPNQDRHGGASGTSRTPSFVAAIFLTALSLLLVSGLGYALVERDTKESPVPQAPSSTTALSPAPAPSPWELEGAFRPVLVRPIRSSGAYAERSGWESRALLAVTPFCPL
jgi:hypothetical protein